MGRDQCLGLHCWCKCARAIFTTSVRNAHKIGLFIFLFVASCNFDKIKSFSVGGATMELAQSAQDSIASLTAQLKSEKDITSNLRQINSLLQGSCGTQSSTQGGDQHHNATSVELPKLLQRQDILDEQAKEFSLKSEKSLQNFQNVRKNIFKMIDK